MTYQSKYHLSLLAAALATLPAGSAFACATCGCSLSSDAAMGYSSSAGWSATLQYDFIDQNQLRTGASALRAAQVAAINNAGGSQEVEGVTTHHYVPAAIGYAPNADWNFKFMLPHIDRVHSTYGQASNPLSASDLSGASVKGIGDAKLIASFQGFLPTHNLGVQLGLKLPTGAYGGPNASASGTIGRNPAVFNSGPNAAQATPDNLLDTSLNAGTGSTDLIVGSYYYQAISQNFDGFVNAQFQTAISHKLNQTGADFKPGASANLSLGLRYQVNPNFVPQLQLNIAHKRSDQGVLADTADSAGTVAYLSPGFTAYMGDASQVYAFLQLPVYSRLQGYQLFPHWTASVGISHSF